jgi:hypothetical protein
LKIFGKHHPGTARARDPGDSCPVFGIEAQGVDAGPRGAGGGRIAFARELKTMSKRLERATLIADIVDALATLADLFRP